MSGQPPSSLSQSGAAVLNLEAPPALSEAEISRRMAAEYQSWPPTAWPDRPVRVHPPLPREMLGTRVLIVMATISLFAFLGWLLMPSHIGDPILYTGLTLAAILRAICLLFEWYAYWAMTIPPEIQSKRKWTVDILTTACPGEPTGMIVRTLKSMAAIRYPHTNYLCDEGNDPYLKAVCEKLGVVHVTRKEKKHAKAGNINNALRQATGQITVVLDPDHDPSPYLLERTLGFFEDPAVGFVQSVQAYGNQGDSFVANAAAQQSYHFYGPFMMGTNGHNTTQAIGANCVFRRAALDSIGGHAAGLAEDMHTAMRLYSKGWRSVYLPEILTRGLTPSSLGAFYKQQVKWACGAFDLLFQEYPKLFRSFTLMQKLHYLICPIFFLRGFIVLLEMLVPVLCLVFGFVAWRAPLDEIMAWFLPMVVMSTLLRLRVQRWLMESHEPGMHSPSGLLTTATWWIYCMGVTCAVLRIKIPYIPTPKDDRPMDGWSVAMPNFIAAGILVAAVAYGLYRDASPSAWFMALLALVNAVSLLYVSLISQQVTMLRLWRATEPARRWFRPAMPFFKWPKAAYDRYLPLMRGRWFYPGSVALVTALFSLNLLYKPFDEWKQMLLGEKLDPDTGGFYTGIDLGSLKESQQLARLINLETASNFRFRLVSLDQTWAPDGIFPAETFKALRRQGAVPMLRWLPTLNAHSPEFIGPVLSERGVLKGIASGKYDDYLHRFADQVRAFGEPVLIAFAPQADDPQTPWSTSGGNTPADFISAWRHVVDLFNEAGASNAGWVWIPAHAANVNAYLPYPGGKGYVDWIGLSQTSLARDGNSFEGGYRALRVKLLGYHLPVMLTDMSAGDESDLGASAGMVKELDNIYPEIKAVVFKAGSLAGATNRSDADSLKNEFKLPLLATGAARLPAADQPLWFDLHPAPRKLTGIEGGPGHFSLTVDGQPFYIKGIAYNPSSDWQDASMPLSRSELDRDFSKIEAMGANTVRRYGQTWSDRTLIDSADAHNLKVLYGFWFMQDVDYLTDDASKKAYEAQIESEVGRYRGHRGILAWCLGNEVWGLLKHRYSQPYLTEVRHAQVLFVDKMARRIKELDPDHPVFCANEFDRVAGAVSDYATGAPSLDGITVNCYYQRDISHLDGIITHVDPSRPYLVSEFGPDGYWDESQNRYDSQKGLLEESALGKAHLYADRWREFIYPDRGRNIGGVAYCWTDRYEGTATWFGLVDFEGEPKPVVSALENAWQFPDSRLAGNFPYSGPKVVKVDYPTAPQWPGEPFIVHAQVEATSYQDLHYEWSVSDASFNRKGRITPLQNGDSASVKLPAAGWYRIQLKVIGKSGLDESNVPVFVQAFDWKNS